MTLTPDQWQLLYPDGTMQKYHQRRSTLDNFKRREGCNTCGKHEDTQPLEFHHVNAEDFSFTISEHLMIGWQQIWDEIQKCIVLCRECHVQRHRELHAVEGPGSRYKRTF
jgi:hypothetical protein